MKQGLSETHHKINMSAHEMPPSNTSTDRSKGVRKEKKRGSLGPLSHHLQVLTLALAAEGAGCATTNLSASEQPLYEQICHSVTHERLREAMAGGEGTLFFDRLPQFVRESTTPPPQGSHPAEMRLVGFVDELPSGFALTQEQITEVIEALPRGWREDTVSDVSFVNHPVYEEGGQLIDHPPAGLHAQDHLVHGGARISPGLELSSVLFTSTAFVDVSFQRNGYARIVDHFLRTLLPHEMAHTIDWTSAPHLSVEQREAFALLFAERIQAPGRLRFREVEQAQAQTQASTREIQMREYFGHLVGAVLSLPAAPAEAHGDAWDMAMALRLAPSFHTSVPEALIDLHLFRRAMEFTAPDDTPEGFHARYNRAIDQAMEQRRHTLFSRAMRQVEDAALRQAMEIEARRNVDESEVLSFVNRPDADRESLALAHALREARALRAQEFLASTDPRSSHLNQALTAWDMFYMNTVIGHRAFYGRPFDRNELDPDFDLGKNFHDAYQQLNSVERQTFFQIATWMIRLSNFDPSVISLTPDLQRRIHEYRLRKSNSRI